MSDDYKSTILIVDDTKFMRHMLRDIFETAGYDVVGEAENGKEAVEMYEELLPDLTTLDISMPVMDGIEALKAIRKFDPAAQIVMVSAMGTKDNVMEAVVLGARNFIVKPFEHHRVMEVIKPIMDQI